MPSAQIGYNLTNTLPETEYQASGKGFNVLDTATDHMGRVWLYVHANGAITGTGYVVTVDEAGEAFMLTATNAAGGDRLGVAPYAFADNDYGWVQVYGVCAAIQVAASVGANVILGSSGTSGQLGTTVTTPSEPLTGIFLTTARGGTAGTAPGVLNWPFVTQTIA